MKLHPTAARIVTSLLLGGMGLTSASAASLLLDFGSTAVTSADATKSPAFAAGAVPGTETSWNQITADTSTLVYSDGTAATGVSIDLGRSAAGVDTIDFNDNGFTVSALGSAYNTGIYAGTSPVKDGIFGGSGSANNLALGLRINGLAAGTYTVYVHGRNTSQGQSATPERFYAKAGSSASAYAFSTGDINALVANSFPANTTSFVLGDNYGKLLVTLTAGQSLFLASEGTTGAELRGFFNTVEVVPASAADLAPKISTQPPATLTALEGAASFTIAAQAQGQPPVSRQWQFNGVALAGATNDMLTLSNITLSMAGTYNLFATNAYGTALSSNCVLTVTPVLNSPQMSNIWNIYAGERVYMNPTNNTERGLAYNPVSGNLLLVSRTPSESVVVLDAATGAEKRFLDVTGVPPSVAGVSLGLNTIGVADDGVVYAASVTVNASTTPFYLYRWNNDSAGTAIQQVFLGDPGELDVYGQRYGDSIAVRGAGSNTQILLAPGSGTNVVLLRTTSGTDFHYEVPPTMLAISGVPGNFAQMGLAFGPGTNTFWAKNVNGQLYLVQFDLNAKTGAVLYAYSGTLVSGSVRGIGVDKNQKWLAGVSV
ncbi:MAG TPA: immunoglobulin domain-containing protein, partial [Bacillota bacterium]|nr:immunoglobulin domain-containing protein [Bacillota bacterium]